MGWGQRFFVIAAPFLREAAIDSVKYQETGARSLYFSQSPAMLNFPNGHGAQVNNEGRAWLTAAGEILGDGALCL